MTTIDSNSCVILGAGAVNTNQITPSKEKPDLHMPFCGAEERDTRILVGSLSLLQGLNFLFSAGFWRIQFPWDLYRKFHEGAVIRDNFCYILPSLAKEE